jgi:hypothetical protein
MESMKKLLAYPHILARIRFRRTEESGRSGPAFGLALRCPSEFDGKFYDCAVYLQGIDPVNPGDVAILPVRFVFPELVKPHLSVGKQFRLRELHNTADCEVLQVYADGAEIRADSADPEGWLPVAQS